MNTLYTLSKLYFYYYHHYHRHRSVIIIIITVKKKKIIQICIQNVETLLVPPLEFSDYVFHTFYKTSLLVRTKGSKNCFHNKSTYQNATELHFASI